MTIFFAMVSAADGAPAPAFFLSEKNAPAGAVQITARRHETLLDAQANGFEIAAGKGGKPTVKKRQTSTADRRAELTRAIRREAARRIDQVSPIWRQLNDSRAATAEGSARFAAIDAIREASNAIEDTLTNIAAKNLGEFPVRENPLWPEID